MRRRVAFPLRNPSLRRKCIEELSAPQPPAEFFGFVMM